MAEKKAFDKYDADHPYSEVTREKTKEIKDPDDSSKTIKVCDDDETYAELRESENKAIASFVKKGCSVMAEDDGTEILHVDPITEISEEQFYAQDSMTNVAKNEYVLFAGSGVYMQIVRQGSGERIKDGESAQVVCRFHEYNISADSLQLACYRIHLHSWSEGFNDIHERLQNPFPGSLALSNDFTAQHHHHFLKRIG